MSTVIFPGHAIPAPTSCGNRLCALALAIFSLATCAAAHAQEYPVRPVRLVVSSSPGSGVDAASAGSIAAHFPDVSRPTASQHLRVLRDAGLLHERRDGTRRLYRTRFEGFTEAQAFFEEFWNDRLTALKAATAAEQRRRDVGQVC